MSLVSQSRRRAGETIAQHASAIAEAWGEAVRADPAIAADENLPDLLLTNQVPALVADIAASLSGDEAAQSDLSIGRRRRGLRFGKLRGLARYDASDLYREFKHLRHAIWRLLRQELDAGRGDVFEVMLVVDQYLDEVIGASLRGFFEASDRMTGDHERASKPGIVNRASANEEPGIGNRESGIAPVPDGPKV
jgi:hypothetical protein